MFMGFKRGEPKDLADRICVAVSDVCNVRGLEPVKEDSNKENSLKPDDPAA